MKDKLDIKLDIIMAQQMAIIEILTLETSDEILKIIRDLEEEVTNIRTAV